PSYPPQAAPEYQAPPANGYQAPPTGGYQTPPPTGGYQTPPAAGGYGQTPPPGYQQPAQQPYYGGYPAAPAGPPMNTLAIVTIILAFVFSPAGIVTGHIGLKQIARTGEAGHGLAKAGLILSYVFTGLWVLIVVASIILPILFALAYGAAYSTY
ncbi:MAG: DUF4190 domain-containing protein, partial [Herbiconiux sp.]|nr:DUF4190 domain-containing protein [Herbiconiux sp.]